MRRIEFVCPSTHQGARSLTESELSCLSGWFLSHRCNPDIATPQSPIAAWARDLTRDSVSSTGTSQSTWTAFGARVSAPRWHWDRARDHPHPAIFQSGNGPADLRNGAGKSFRDREGRPNSSRRDLHPAGIETPSGGLVGPRFDSLWRSNAPLFVLLFRQGQGHTPLAKSQDQPRQILDFAHTRKISSWFHTPPSNSRHPSCRRMRSPEPFCFSRGRSGPIWSGLRPRIVAERLSMVLLQSPNGMTQRHPHGP
jgi:hypothetical protein